MAEHHAPVEDMAAAVDVAAGALLSAWDAARERAINQLSSSQLRAVMVVEEQDGINLRGLAGTLGMLLSSASRLCDRLVAAGMLDRVPGRLDRREISLHLTPVGRKVLDELRDDRRERLARVLAGMSPAGQRALLRGLNEFEAAARAAAAANSAAGGAGGAEVEGVAGGAGGAEVEGVAGGAGGAELRVAVIAGEPGPAGEHSETMASAVTGGLTARSA